VKKGWQTEKLGDVCAFLNRGISPHYLESGGICVLNQKCIREHRVSYEPSRRHDAQAKKVGSDRLVQAGDVLVNSTGTGTLGRVAQLRENPSEPTTVDSHVTIVRPKQGKFYQDFFGYMLVVIEDAIKEAGEGCGGQTELARSILAEKFKVHYPESLPEQQRIVGILDEAFEGIAIAKANAEKNLQNARALFESHLQSVFTQHGEGWVEKPLGEICERITKGSSPKWQGIAYVDKPGILFVTSENVGEYQILMDHPKYVDEKFNAKDRKSILKPGDVLTNIVGASIGRTAVFNLDELANINQAVCLIRCQPTLLNNFFLTYLLNSPIFKQVLHDNEVDNARANLSLGFFSQLPVPMPSIPKQIEIVEKLNTFREKTQCLESIYQQKLAALEELKKSLLHQAFTGSL
jgi:type I restriction enzyme S subunit